MGITSAITHRLLTLSRSGLILNRGLNACIIPTFIGISRTVASAAAAKKPTTKAAAAATLNKPPKPSAEGRAKGTATKAAIGKNVADKKPAKPKAAAKKSAKKPAKKELTDEQKKKALIKKLRLEALKPPTRLGINGYSLWFGEEMKKQAKSAGQLAEGWRALPQEVKDAYGKKAEEARPDARAQFKAWLILQSPFAIRNANNARRRLKALGVSSGTTPIPDDRLPKRVPGPVFMYAHEQFAKGRKFLDGEGKNDIILGGKIMREEFEKLPASEKKRFDDMVEQNRKAYAAEMAKLEKEHGI